MKIDLRKKEHKNFVNDLVKRLETLGGEVDREWVIAQLRKNVNWITPNKIIRD